jgi:hypothetical protein
MALIANQRQPWDAKGFSIVPLRPCTFTPFSHPSFLLINVKSSLKETYSFNFDPKSVVDQTRY